jgi:hypothetical protein
MDEPSERKSKKSRPFEKNRRPNKGQNLKKFFRELKNTGGKAAFMEKVSDANFCLYFLFFE